MNSFWESARMRCVFYLQRTRLTTLQEPAPVPCPDNRCCPVITADFAGSDLISGTSSVWILCWSKVSVVRMHVKLRSHTLERCFFSSPKSRRDRVFLAAFHQKKSWPTLNCGYITHEHRGDNRRKTPGGLCHPDRTLTCCSLHCFQASFRISSRRQLPATKTQIETHYLKSIGLKDSSRGEKRRKRRSHSRFYADFQRFPEVV